MNWFIDLSFSLFFRVPVSLFGDDSIYEVSAPRVDSETQNLFLAHVNAGQGLNKAMCREDVAIYREYVKNRYMWHVSRVFCRRGGKKNDSLVDLPHKKIISELSSSAALGFLKKIVQAELLLCLVAFFYIEHNYYIYDSAMITSNVYVNRLKMLCLCIY